MDTKHRLDEQRLERCGSWLLTVGSGGDIRSPGRSVSKEQVER
jgi:hypothetical protein